MRNTKHKLRRQIGKEINAHKEFHVMSMFYFLNYFLLSIINNNNNKKVG
jgi:hypothetical protein